MTSSGESSRALHDGVQPMLKDFTREAVKTMPDNVVDFACEYFSSRGELKTDFSVRSVYQLPPGFLELLKDFTKEILQQKVQADDLYDFGADYFASIAEQQAEQNAELPSTEELLDIVTGIFVEADTEGRGYLDVDQFFLVSSLVASQGGLNN